MTILWDLDPSASETYRFALGDSVTVLNHGARVAREVEDGGHRLVVIGPDVSAEGACEFASHVRVDHPEVGVIMLRHRLDVTVLAQALRSGVREVVQADDQLALVDAVRRSESLSAQLGGPGQSGGADAGKLVTVFSAKGGVGKTTVAVNMATYLASTGARVLLVDLDLMFGDVGISLQLAPATTIMDVVAMRGHLDADGLKSVVAKHEPSGLDVLVAPSDPADAERVLADAVLELLRTARATYDYVVVDTAPSMTEHVLAAFDVSDLIVLLATLDIPAVKNLRIAINTLDTLGAPQENRTVVLNRSDLKVGLTSKEVQTALRHPISADLPNSLTVPTASNRGVALVLEHPRNPFAIAMRDLVDQQVRARFGDHEGTEERKRGFGLLRGAR